MTTADAMLAELRRLGSAENRVGMARYGINVDRADGVKKSDLRAIAKRLGRDQARAEDLWNTGRHEARLLAVLTGEPKRISDAVLARWVADLDSWDLCDGFCNDLVRRTADPWGKVEAWVHREEEFVRRAGFALLANLAVHDKAAPDARFLAGLELVELGASDERNFVAKAVNWALRQIGKRNAALHAPALALAEKLAARSEKTARWIGHDARRELASDKVRAKLKP